MSLAVVEPATAEVMAEVPRAGADEVDAAVAAAKAAFPEWRATSLSRRLCAAVSNARAASSEVCASPS